MAAGHWPDIGDGGGPWAPPPALDSLFSDEAFFGGALPQLPSPPPLRAAALLGYPHQDNFDVFHSQDLAHLAAQVAQKAELQEKLGAGLCPKITPHLAYSKYSTLDQADNSSFSLVTPALTSQHVSSSVIAASMQGMPTLPSHIDSVSTTGSTGVLQILQGSSIALDRPADDGYNWRKYGQKAVKGGKYPRSYYKCTLNCPVRKNVEHSLDGRIIKIVYRGQHCHERPAKRFKDCGDLLNELDYFSDTEKVSVRSQLDSQGHHGKPITLVGTMADHLSPTREEAVEQLSGSGDSREEGDDEIGAVDGDDGDANADERNAPGQKIIVSTTSDVDLLDDGYRWRKYGQKVVRGNPHPRSYYKCTYQGCDVKKHIERSCQEPLAVITTYEGKHIHDVPASRNRNQATGQAYSTEQSYTDQSPASFCSSSEKGNCRTIKSF